MVPDQPVTLAVVAKVAGVSRATASRAMNDRDGVAPDVRERIKVVAESLGYRPNRAARNLANGRSSVIGLIIESDELRVDPFGASLVHAVARATESIDHSLMLLLASSEPGDLVARNLRDGLIDGLIISSVATGQSWVEELLDSRLPTVLIGSHLTRTDVSQVETESREASCLLVEHLFEQECKRVAIITGILDRVDAAQRLAGYRDAHERRGLVVDESLVFAGDFTHLSGQHAAEQLLGQGIDGLFASNDEMALGAMSVFERSRVDVPGDIAVVGFDGTYAAERVGVSLTTCQQPFAQLGATAVEFLLAELDGSGSATIRLISPEFSLGGSSQRLSQ